MSTENNNFDEKVVADFGREWEAFNQKALTDTELKVAFDQYFHIFPFDKIGPSSVGFDMGCGSGRWAKLVAPRVNSLNCIDASSTALEQARKNLSHLDNCKFECAPVSNMNIEDGSQDFGYCLGVLHHIPDTQAGLSSCVAKLKKGAPFLLYLYYRFDNKPAWFKSLWLLSDLMRRAICRLPFPLKLFACQIIALLVYWPLARAARLLEMTGANVANAPLADYRSKSIYFMRTDALDRFGTRLEKRFTRDEMREMMKVAGLSEIEFSSSMPYWVAVGIKS